MKLKEAAARIDAHLNRFERDPKINKVAQHGGMKTREYYGVGAITGGSRVFVTYIRYQGSASLTKAQAEAYLGWLDGGNIGRHYEMEKQNERQR
jgi:hypothetical protein